MERGEPFGESARDNEMMGMDPRTVEGNNENESISETQFTDCRSLAEILDRLQTLEENDQSIQGSSRTYTPTELREKLYEASTAVERTIHSQMRRMQSDPDSMNDLPALLSVLPEVREITRAGGLRDAFVRVATENGAWFHGFDMDADQLAAGSIDLWKNAFQNVPNWAKRLAEHSRRAEKRALNEELIMSLAQQLGVDPTTGDGKRALIAELNSIASSLSRTENSQGS